MHEIRLFDFSLDQLAMFVAVVDAGTFAGASERVGRVQSAVSAAIAKLERSLGTPLFDRSGRSSKLTAAGRRLVAEARLVVGQAREITECAASLQAGVEASLSVAVDALFPRGVLFDALAAFHREFPTVLLRLHEDIMARSLVESGQVDLGICNMVEHLRGTRGLAPELVTRPCREVRLVPVCGAGHPLARSPAPQPEQQLRSAVQIVLTERGAPSHADQGVLGARTWRVTDLQTKLGMLEAGIGWGSVPLETARPGIEAGRLARLHPVPWPDGHRIELFAINRAATPLGPAGRWLAAAFAGRGDVGEP